MLDKFTFDIIEKMMSAQSLGDIDFEMDKIRAAFDFTSHIVTGLPEAETPMLPLVLSSHWPSGWTERYHKQDYCRHDPVVTVLRKTDDPFVWSSVRTQKLTVQGARVLDEASEFGLADGIAIPVRGLFRLDGAVSFGGTRVSITDRERAAVHMMGLYGYEAYVRLTRPPASHEKLSPREVECAKWASDGKTAWEIGQILNISEATVNEYMQSASRKLNVTNRTHLVARCLRLRIIS